MKVFIGLSWDEKSRLDGWAKYIKNLGHTVAYEWWKKEDKSEGVVWEAFREALVASDLVLLSFKDKDTVSYSHFAVATFLMKQVIVFDPDSKSGEPPLPLRTIVGAPLRLHPSVTWSHHKTVCYKAVSNALCDDFMSYVLCDE